MTAVYTKFKNNLVYKCMCNDNQIKTLKDKYKNNIQSTRRLENTNNLLDLITLLEKRDVVNDKNVTAFEEIALFLNRPDLIIGLNDISLEPARSEVSQQSLTGIPCHEKACNLIATDIGLKWKEFARALKVKEGQIDNLEDKHKNIGERVLEILRNYEQNCSVRFWNDVLEALSKARRNDLRKEVQMMLHIN